MEDISTEIEQIVRQYPEGITSLRIKYLSVRSPHVTNSSVQIACGGANTLPFDNLIILWNIGFKLKGNRLNTCELHVYSPDLC